MARRLQPRTFQAAAAALAGAAAAGETVRILGAQTKKSWGREIVPADAEIHTGGLDRVLEHHEADLTAVLEAGVPLARAQDAFARAGQMLALDPWLGSERKATIGGVLATGDSGPLRHRYGAPRDLVLGMTVALSDGTIARSGGKVIKNVAGYDVAKLFCGSFGTLGLILSVNVRLHPLAPARVTALAGSEHPPRLAGAARELAARPLELEALDVAWHDGQGSLLARCAGSDALRRARRVAQLMREAGLAGIEVAEEDGALWERQRAGQRSSARALVRVAHPPSQLAAVIACARAGSGTMVGRAALGTSYIELEPGAVTALRSKLPQGTVSVLLDAPPEFRAALSPWEEVGDPAAEDLMRRIKARFDPSSACNPGIFVAGI